MKTYSGALKKAKTLKSIVFLLLQQRQRTEEKERERERDNEGERAEERKREKESQLLERLEEVVAEGRYF